MTTLAGRLRNVGHVAVAVAETAKATKATKAAKVKVVGVVALVALVLGAALMANQIEKNAGLAKAEEDEEDDVEDVEDVEEEEQGEAGEATVRLALAKGMEKQEKQRLYPVARKAKARSAVGLRRMMLMKNIGRTTSTTWRQRWQHREIARAMLATMDARRMRTGRTRQLRVGSKTTKSGLCLWVLCPTKTLNYSLQRRAAFTRKTTRIVYVFMLRLCNR